MKKKKKEKLFIPAAVLAAVFLFTGCLGEDGEVYGQEKVLEYVNSICKEPCRLEGKKLVEENPDNMEYYFRTQNRDLSFQANSFLSPVTIDLSAPLYYTRGLSCSYVQEVHNLYREELEAVLQADQQYLEEYGWIYLMSFDDIDRTVDTILAADQVYRQELEYNSEDFLKENPLTSIHLVWQRSQQEAKDHETWVNMTNVGITGQNQKEELTKRLGDLYAQLCVDGKIENAQDVPEEYLADKHVSLLSVIELNGEEMLYDEEDNPCGVYRLNTEDYKYCWYNKELKSYMLVMDTGLLDDSMSYPMINREYVKALGGSYRAAVRDDAYISAWSIDGDTWTMKTEYGDGSIQELQVEKNGREIDLPYLTVEEDSNVGATFCAGVRAEDFCRLFDLTYEVDEEQGKIMFARAKG
mgnify:CR=1 FL=1